MSSETEIHPFQVDMPDEMIAGLRRRVAATCWPGQELVADGSQGVQLATMQELARYWATDYDWRACEARLNALPQFKTQIDGLDIHFIHVRSRHENALPLIITHGWPGSVIEMLGVVGPLTDPTAYGGSAEDAFDLVLPSLPGYGFSEAPAEVGWDPSRVARAWAELMSRLGYARYVAQGGDIGANVTDAMGRLAPDGLLGIHLNFLSAFPTDVLAAVFGGSLPGAGLFNRQPGCTGRPDEPHWPRPRPGRSLPNCLSPSPLPSFPARSSRPRAAGLRRSTPSSPTSARPNGAVTSPPRKSRTCSPPKCAPRSAHCADQAPRRPPA
jgi:pimeloyl-ACP methyl ester carboxylesterase